MFDYESVKERKTKRKIRNFQMKSVVCVEARFYRGCECNRFAKPLSNLGCGKGEDFGWMVNRWIWTLSTAAWSLDHDPRKSE